MAVQYNATMRVGNGNTGVNVVLGAGAPGGGIGVRVTVDDATLTSKEQVIICIESIVQAIIAQSWPAA